MTNIETIRKAFDKWIKGSLKTEDFVFLKTIPSEVKNQALGFYHGYKIALSTIDPDAKPQGPSKDDMVFAHEIFNIIDLGEMFGGLDDAAILIHAHDDAIRQECAEKANSYDVMEQLAAIEHDRWSGQAKTALNDMTDIRRERWGRLAVIPYPDLDEANKELDRIQVREYLPIIIAAMLAVEPAQEDNNV